MSLILLAKAFALPAPIKGRTATPAKMDDISLLDTAPDWSDDSASEFPVARREDWRDAVGSNDDKVKALAATARSKTLPKGRKEIGRD